MLCLWHTKRNVWTRTKYNNKKADVKNVAGLRLQLPLPVRRHLNTVTTLKYRHTRTHSGGWRMCLIATITNNNNKQKNNNKSYSILSIAIYINFIFLAFIPAISSAAIFFLAASSLLYIYLFFCDVPFASLCKCKYDAILCCYRLFIVVRWFVFAIVAEFCLFFFAFVYKNSEESTKKNEIKPPKACGRRAYRSMISYDNESKATILLYFIFFSSDKCT